MTAKIIPFRDPMDPLPFPERMVARRAFRAGAKVVAGDFVAAAFEVCGRLPGTKYLGCEDALPLFVAAMRRELRKSELF